MMDREPGKRGHPLNSRGKPTLITLVPFTGTRTRFRLRRSISLNVIFAMLKDSSDCGNQRPDSHNPEKRD
jgi:hypothetical protein